MKNGCNPSGCRHFAYGDERTRERITLPTAHNFYLSRENLYKKNLLLIALKIFLRMLNFYLSGKQTSAYLVEEMHLVAEQPYQLYPGKRHLFAIGDNSPC